jgi:protoheme ferro-lyase
VEIFLTLTCFFGDIDQSERFYLGGVHLVHGVPRSSFGGDDGYVMICHGTVQIIRAQVQKQSPK